MWKLWRRSGTPNIEWRAVEGAADDVGVMRGHNALRRYYEDWIDTLDGLRAEVEEIIVEADDRVAPAASLRRGASTSPAP
jgi:ketosteroid isomerase-like protein